MLEQTPDEIIATIRAEMAAAADTILTHTENSLRDLAADGATNAIARVRVEAALCSIMEACAFQDIIGQRLGQLTSLLAGAPTQTVQRDPLLNGPAASGSGLAQAAADALMCGNP